MSGQHFEPPLAGLVEASADLQPYDAVEESYMRALQPFTDLQLLLELRRRKRLKRVEVSSVLPGEVRRMMVEDHGDLWAHAYQLRKLLEGELALALIESGMVDGLPTGYKRKLGHFVDERRPRHDIELASRITFPLNYVVGPL